jgi:hypothetical protein
MYILLIFNDQDCEKLNCIWLYDSVSSVMADTKGLIKYSDINRKTRIYKTAKSFFRVLKVSSSDTKLYFK